MKLRKITLGIITLSAMILTLSLASCSKKAGAQKSSSGITLTVWESLDGPDEFISKAGEAWTKLHPEVNIRYVNVELGDAAGQIALDGPGGVGPDVFAAPHDKLGELVNGGHVLATENAEDVKNAVLSSCAKALTYEGRMYGYPVSAETYALFYNNAFILINRVFRNQASDSGQRINIGISSDDCTRIQYRVTANFNMITDHGAKLLQTGLNVFFLIVDNN